MKISIYEDALAQIIASAVDAFPKECFGHLFGNRKDETFKLNSAYNMSSLRRTEDTVFYKPQKVKTIGKILEKVYKKNINFLGTYHSHPNYLGTELSELDGETNIEDEKVQIIISIKKTKKSKNCLKHSPNQINMSGIIDNYYFKLGGFYYNENKKRFQSARFDVPPKNLVQRINFQK